jgi:hypothetical protein
MAVDWEAYARGVEADIVQLKKDLAPLEAGEMTIGERRGSGPWRDVTAEQIGHGPIFSITSRSRTALLP